MLYNCKDLTSLKSDIDFYSHLFNLSYLISIYSGDVASLQHDVCTTALGSAPNMRYTALVQVYMH